MKGSQKRTVVPTGRQTPAKKRARSVDSPGSSAGPAHARRAPTAPSPPAGPGFKDETAARPADSPSLPQKSSPTLGSGFVDSESNPRPPAVTAGDLGTDRSEKKTFPVVGIGASAGGLEALEKFLRNVPIPSGMAFVVVQHLDPAHKGSLVELLQRTTSMPVIQVHDQQKVEPNNVYVIPPGKDLSIFHGELHLAEQVAPRGLNLPIDHFFRSLAEDQQEKSIAVILSGMGSDGTLGLRALKEKAGASFVQSPSSAKFDGMPRSAIDASLADVVAPVEELPARILAYRQHMPYIGKEVEEPLDKQKSAIEQVFVLLRSHTGNDFSLYKKGTIQRRIERRMGLHQMQKIGTYIRFLREHPREIDLLFRELLIGVTSFFRDPPAWEYLKNEVMPTLLARRHGGEFLRAWVPGCSTGEEAYSLAMVFKEALEALKPPKNLSLQIFATDLDADAIEKARVGMYPANIAQDVSPERLRRFFVQDDRSFRVTKDIREMVVFAPQNIIMDPPFTKLDILSCRNLLIYLAPELQRKLIPLFHYALNRNGVLFLGSAETIGSYTGLFVALEGKARLYRRLEAGVGAVPVEFPAGAWSKTGAYHEAPGEDAVPIHRPPLNLPTLVNHVLVQHFAPAAVLTSDKGDILYVSGRTGKYLEPAVGKASMNLFAMARQGLRLELSSAFTEALRDDRITIVRGIKVGTNGGTQTIDLTVQRLSEPRDLRGTMLVVFTDTGAAAPPLDPQRPAQRVPASRLIELEKELQRAQDEIQTTREEMQTSQEELKSTNEELQSTNEELQSTNEELTTSKEEMQSMNEELQTVNHELHAKLDELSRSNNDMKNLLNSTDIATLFLDSDLHVRRFTSPITTIIKLIPSDIGRPITDIARDIDYPELVDDAKEVLRTLVFKEKVVGATNERWFAVRVMPYRTLENVIDGVVLTFSDAAIARSMEAGLRQQASELRQMAESLPHLVWGCQPDGTCDYISPQWTEYTGIPADELFGYGWLHAVDERDRERVRAVWHAAISAEAPMNVDIRLRAKDGQVRWFNARTVPIRGAGGKITKWYGSNSDVDDLKRTAERRNEAVVHLQNILGELEEPVITLAGDHSISYLNEAARRLIGDGTSGVGQNFFRVLPQIDKALFEAQSQEVAEGTLEVQLAAGEDASFKVRLFAGPGSGVVLFQRKKEEPPSEPRDAVPGRESP